MPASQTLSGLPSDSLLLRLAPPAPVPDSPDLIAWQAPDVFDLWRGWENESGKQQDIPYWAIVWPAARLIASWLGRHAELVAGRTVLDIGCGGGLAGIAAAKAGAARVIANDTDGAALAMAMRNASANGVSLEIESGNLLAAPPSPVWDVLLVGDLFYEKSVAEPMMAWLRMAKAQGGLVLIADGSRPFGPRTGVSVLAEARYATDPDLEGVSNRAVRLLELTDG